MRLRGRGEPVGAARSNFFVDLPRRSTYESMSDIPNWTRRLCGWASQTTGPRDWGFVRSNPRFLEGLAVIPREDRPAELTLAVFSALRVLL